MTEIDRYAPVVDGARAMLAEAKGFAAPEGQVKDTMADRRKAEGTGLRAALYALAEFIESKQDGPAVEANKELVRHLRGDDPSDPYIDEFERLEPLADLITNAAIADPEGLPAAVRTLRGATQISGDDVFERLSLAIKNIARDHDIMLDDTSRQVRGDRSRGKPEDSSDKGDSADDDEVQKKLDEPDDFDKGEQEKDKGTWRESIHQVDDIAPKVDEEEIEKSADSYDGAYIDEKTQEDIEKSAQNGPEEFRPTADSEYERDENSPMKGFGLIRDQMREGREIRDYWELLQEVKAAYDDNLAAAIQASGRQIS